MAVENDAKFRVERGEILFLDGEDSVRVHTLQRLVSGTWMNVLELHLEGGRSWGDEIDLLYRHKTSGALLLHVSGFGYWGDAEFYASLDGGVGWEPTPYKREPDPHEYDKEGLEQIVKI
jgi:hypothetical protein